jgi:hypothetical protein
VTKRGQRHPLISPNSSRRRKEEHVTNPKKCPKCEWYMKPEAFRADACSIGKAQSYCYACKDQWEREPNGIYRRCMAWLRANEPEVFSMWTKEAWLGKFERQGGRCHYCKGDLCEWQFGGIRLDRQNNSEEHTVENTVIACFPCNITRGTMNVATFMRVIETLRSQYGDHINWEEMDKRFKRNKRRSTAHLRVLVPQEVFAL